MPYVKRDAQGQIVAAMLEPGEGLAAVPGGAPELQEFMRRMGMEQSSLEQSDMRLVRVLEDLIDLLIARDVIRFTDLPQPAQEKLLERRSLRQSMGALDLLGGGNETI
ncbi:MAG: hypothetical protein AB1593_05330 [Pseudomonadota bacterium]